MAKRKIQTTWVVFAEDEVFEETNTLTAEQMFEKYPNAYSIEAFDLNFFWS